MFLSACVAMGGEHVLHPPATEHVELVVASEVSGVRYVFHGLAWGEQHKWHHAMRDFESRCVMCEGGGSASRLGVTIISARLRLQRHVFSCTLSLSSFPDGCSAVSLQLLYIRLQ